MSDIVGVDEEHASEAVILTLDQLGELCLKWQAILRLQDWTVAVQIVRARDMEIDNAMGECDWVLPRKEAIVRIRDPIDYPENRIFMQDMERTLVHELLHLHFAPIAIHEGDDEIFLEQAMHGIDGALVRLDRDKEDGA